MTQCAGHLPEILRNILSSRILDLKIEMVILEAKIGRKLTCVLIDMNKKILNFQESVIAFRAVPSFWMKKTLILWTTQHISLYCGPRLE